MTRAVPEWIADHDDQAVPRLVKARTIITEEDVLARVQNRGQYGLLAMGRWRRGGRIWILADAGTRKAACSSGFF